MHRRIDTAELADADINDASSVEFRAWAPLSAERTYRFTEDFVRCIYKPHEEVVGQYFAILQKWQEANKVIEIDKSMKRILLLYWSTRRRNFRSIGWKS